MKINEILYKSLINCNWFQSSGSMDNISYNFDRQIVTSRKQLIKNIQSLSWENICQDAQGDLMEYLGTYYTEEFDNYWNKNVIYIKKNYLPTILDNINGAIKDKDFSPEIIYSISHNILMIIISDYYSGYYESVFFKNLLEIYLSGHIPCGWKGKYPEGRIMVY